MSLVVPPQDDCPKCGEWRGFHVSSPRYVKEDDYLNQRGDLISGREYLAWPCQRCGYEVETKTGDAQ